MKAKELSGQVFSRLSVIKRVGSRDGRALWECKCECGETHNVVSKRLVNGEIKSCGCLRSDSEKLFDKHKADLVGSIFGRLTVVSKSKRDASGYRWNCKCECGANTEIQRSALTSGAVKSCGCYQREKTKQVGHDNTTHGASKRGGTATYKIWVGMHSRCRKTYNHKYGGRGISVCKRWNDYELFLEDMGARPTNLSIDRIDSNGNYEPSNCRWATARQQANNRRTNKVFLYKGESKTLAELSRMFGIKGPTIMGRLQRGWSLEDSVTRKVER